MEPSKDLNTQFITVIMREILPASSSQVSIIQSRC